MKIFKISEIDINLKIKKIVEETTKIPKENYEIMLYEKIVMILVKENIFLTEITMLKKILLEKLLENKINVENIIIKLNKKNTRIIKISNKKEIEKDKILKEILENNKEKFMEVENEIDRKYLINLLSLSQAKEKLSELNKEKKCKKCGMYNKTLKCIFCINDRIKIEIPKIKEKLYNKYNYTKDYATKIDKFLLESYIDARDEVLQEKFKEYYNTKDNKKLVEYIKYLIQSDKKILIDVEIKKIKKKLEEIENENIKRKTK